MGSSTELIIVIAAAGGVAVAYATNLGGFKTWLDGLFRGGSRAIQGVKYGIGPTGLVNIGGAGLNPASPPGYIPGYIPKVSGATPADVCAKKGLAGGCKAGFHGVVHPGGGCDCVKGYASGYASAYNTNAYPEQSITVS